MIIGRLTNQPPGVSPRFLRGCTVRKPDANASMWKPDANAFRLMAKRKAARDLLSPRLMSGEVAV